MHTEALCDSGALKESILDRLQRIKRQKLLNAAEGYLLLGLFPQALTSLDEVPVDDSDNTAVDLLRGETLRSMERHSDALEAYNRAFAVDPQNISLLLAMAWCYKRTSQLPRAITALEQARNLEPKQAIVHYNLACYWALAGNRNESLTCLRRGLTQDPTLRRLIPEESDFDSLRDDPEFRQIIGEEREIPQVPES